MTNFPDHDFKIDCGDDPKVRQWLHYNGCRIDDIPDRQVLLFIEAKNVQTCCNSRAFFELDPLPQIDPYDFIKPEPTVAERMAALIEEYKADIPDWARCILVSRDGDLQSMALCALIGSIGCDCLTADTFSWSGTTIADHSYSRIKRALARLNTGTKTRR